MGARTREVGGGSAVGVANDFNSFLSQQLRGGSAPSRSDPRFLRQFNPNDPNTNFDNWARQHTSNSMQPGQQTSNFQNAFQGALSGQVNDMSGAGGALQNFFQNPSANNLNIPQFQNQFTSPQFQQAQLNQLPTNFGQGQTGMADLSQFGNAAQSGFNTQQGFGAQGTSQFTGAFQNALANMGQGAPGVNAQQASLAGPQSLGARPELAQAMDYGAAYNTLGQDPLMERNRMKAVADMRARFGAEGAGAMGTGAQVAEGNLNAELAAQDASQRRAQAMQLMGQDLNERSTGANVALQGRGQDASYLLGNRNTDAGIAQTNAQLGTQASMANASNALSNNANIMQSILGARGQDFSNQLGNRNADISQLGLGSQQSMFNAGQSNDMQTAMMNAFLQNQGLGNNFALGGAQLNNNAMQTNNANNINTSQFQNTFNQGNAQLGAQFGQANNALNSQNMLGQTQINNQMLQNMIGQGLNMNQLGNANTMAMLAQLFGGFGQSNALGTVQRQNVVTPSPWGQAAGMLGSLGSAWLQGGGGNPFGGGGGNTGMPQLPVFNPNIGMTPGWQNPGQQPPPIPVLR